MKLGFDTFELNTILEVVNGLWTLLTAFFVIFLVVHFQLEWNYRRMSVSEWFSLPLGMQVAVSLFIADLGTVMTRGAVWEWRMATDGVLPMSNSGVFFLIGGATLAAIGILCQIRVFTRAYLGHWPWMTVAFAALLYLSIMLMPLVVGHL